MYNKIIMYIYIIYSMYCDGFCRYTSISNRRFFTDHPWPMAVGIAMFPRLGPMVPGVPSSRSLRGGDTLSHSPVSRSLDGGKAVFPWGNHGFMGEMMAIRKYHGKITDIFFGSMVVRMQFILHMTSVWWYCVGIHGMRMERHIMTSRRDVTGMVTMAELLSLVNVYCYNWYNVRIYIYILYIYNVYIYI